MLPSHAEQVAALEALGPTPSWTQGEILATLSRPTTAGWVATEDGRVVGHLLSTLVAGEAEILILSVDPTFRRQRVGLTLLAHAAARWTEGRVQRAFLEVRADNEPARRLYVRAGWALLGVRPGYYADGTDAMVMEWVPGAAASAATEIRFDGKEGSF